MPSNHAAKRSRDIEHQSFHPFRRRLLDLLNEFGLGHCSWKSRHDVNMIGSTIHACDFTSQITADGRNVRMQPRPNVFSEPRFTILRAEDDVENDFAQRLRHGLIMHKALK